MAGPYNPAVGPQPTRSRPGRSAPRVNVAAMCVALVMTASLALAQDGGGDASTPPRTPACGGLLIVCLICNGLRKQPIGGWLLFFYIQVIVGGVMTAAFAPGIAENLVSPDWESGWLKGMFALSVVPALLAQAAATAAAIAALFARRPVRNPPFHFLPTSAQVLKALQWSLAAWAATSVLSLIVDWMYFQDQLGLSVFASIAPIAWFLYFRSSRRVEMVFETLNWDYARFAPEKLRRK